MKKNALGIAALLVGILALGLAVLPGVVLDKPLPFLDDRPERPPLEESEPEGSVTLKINKFSISFGGGDEDDEAKKEERQRRLAEQIARKQQRDQRNKLLKWFTISAVSLSLVGLVLGPISWTREKEPALSGSAISICCLALIWQYLVIGIVVGVAIAVLLTLLGSFSG